jgi:large subunit ribosomal protein L24
LSSKPSVKPGKNRKNRYDAANHVRRKFMTAPLSPALKAQYGFRSIPVRKDDTVTITKGDRKLTEGRVTRVDVAHGRLYLEGVTRQKLDGTTVTIPIRAENVMITKLDLDDEWRRRILERRGYESERERRQ